jgi:hypothetical protein
MELPLYAVAVALRASRMAQERSEIRLAAFDQAAADLAPT